MADRKNFLMDNRSEIIQGTRNPLALADDLLAKKCIDKETYDKVKTQKTNQDKLRKIYDCLNTEKLFDCTYDWLKKNEPELLEELEKRDKEPGAPQKKRARHDNEDETDGNFTGCPDLKTISTYSELESWVSTPEMSQKLISYLERKLGVDGMEALKEQLKDKEPKKTLCFNACSIDEIRRNKELDTFHSSPKSTKIPKLTFSMFFKKRGSASSGNKTQSFTDYEESMDTTGELSSSGYESLLSSSFIDSFFQPNLDHSPNIPRQRGVSLHQTDQLTKNEMPLEDESGSRDMQDKHVDEMAEDPQGSNVPNVPRNGAVSLGHNDPNTKRASQLQDVLGSTDTQDANTAEKEEQSQRSNVLRHQDESITKESIPLEGTRGSMDMQETSIHDMMEQPQGSNVPNVPRNGAVSLGQNDPNTKRATQLPDVLGSTDTQDANTDEKEEQSQTSSRKDESITKTATAVLDRCGNTEMQRAYIQEMTEQPQGSNVPNIPRNRDIPVCQNDPITKRATQLQDGLGSREVQDTYTDEMDDGPQRSNVPVHEDESITKKATPLEDTCRDTDLQEAYIEDMKSQPQASNVPNEESPRNVGVSLQPTDPFSEKDHLPPNDKRLPHEDICTVSGPTEDTDTESKTPKQVHNGSFVHHETKADEPLQKSTQDKYSDELEEQSQTVQIHEEESIPSKATPLEDTGGDTDMQEEYNHGIIEQPQGSNVPNIPRQRSVSLQQTDQLTMPLEDESGSRDMQDKHVDEMAEDPQGSNVPNVPRNGAVSLGHNDPNTKRASQLQDVLGSTDMPDANTAEKEEQSQRSNVLRHQDESITKESIPLEGTRGSMDMQETSIHDTMEQPQGSNVPNEESPRNVGVSLQPTDPFSKKDHLPPNDKRLPHEDICTASGPTEDTDVIQENENAVSTESKTPKEVHNGSFVHHETKADEPLQKSTQDKYSDELEEQSRTVQMHEEESIPSKATPPEDTGGDTDMQEEMIEQPQGSNVPDVPWQRSELSKQQQKNSPGSASPYSHSHGTEIVAPNTAPSRKKDPIEAAKKREKFRLQKEKKKTEKDQLLRAWAERQCEDIGKEEFVSQILFKSLAEHSDFPCFTAEDVMIYKALTPESQIIFITDDNTSIKTMTTVHYCMFVCKINKAIILGPKKPTEQEIRYNKSKVPIDKCKDFIFKVFAPVLTLYKQIYKEEKLHTLVGGQ